MDRENKYLVGLTEKYLNGKPIVLSKEINYKHLFNSAVHHNLFGVIYCAVSGAQNKEIIEPDFMKTLKSKFSEVLFLCAAQNAAAERLKSALTGAEIRYVFFKGNVLKEYYPIPESRIMGDIDVLIDKENREKAKTALTNAGFKCKNSNGPVWDYVHDGVLVEVHTSLVNGKVGKSSAAEFFKGAIDRAEFSGFEGKFSDTFHFEYLIAHIAHHFWFNGAGIKMILDLAVMLSHGKTDLSSALSDLDEMRLGNFSREIISVCRKWYGFGVQYNTDVSATEDFLLSHGAFGKTLRNESAVAVRKALEEEKSTSPLLMKLRLAFPPYKKLMEIPYIKFIEGKPWLTPYAWCYRFIYNLKYRKELTFATVKGLDDSESAVLAREELEYFKEIGLL